MLHVGSDRATRGRLARVSGASGTSLDAAPCAGHIAARIMDARFCSRISFSLRFGRRGALSCWRQGGGMGAGPVFLALQGTPEGTV